MNRRPRAKAIAVSQHHRRQEILFKMSVMALSAAVLGFVMIALTA